MDSSHMAPTRIAPKPVCQKYLPVELVSNVVEIASRWFSSSGGDCPLGAHRQLG